MKMKLRPVLLVILLLSGFYYLTTHVASTGAFAPWLHRVVEAPAATTASTVQKAMGSFEVTEAVLNHVSGHKAGVAGVYNRSSYDREVNSALGLWDDHVTSLVTGRDRKVIPMRGTSIPA